MEKEQSKLMWKINMRKLPDKTGICLLIKVID